MQFLTQGVILGLSVSVLLGPMIFLFIDASMQRGKMGGFLVGLGAWCSDFLYIVLSYFFFSQLLHIIENPKFKLVLGMIGGVLLIILGLFLVLSKANTNTNSKTDASQYRSDLSIWLKGFLVNMLNPFCAILWMGAISTMMMSGAKSVIDLTWFAVGSLGCIILTDVFKIFLAKKLGSVIDSKQKVILSRVAGIGIILFGIWMIIRIM